MSATASSNPFAGKVTAGGGGEKPDAGQHLAVLAAVIDLGSHEEEYQGVAKTVRQAYLVWELVHEKKAGGTRNHTIGRVYSLSFNKKAGLIAMLEKVRGKAYAEGEEPNVQAALGRPCQVLVEHKTAGSGNVYARIKDVTAPPRGTQVPPPQYPPVFWYIGNGQPVPEHDWVPYWVGEPVKAIVERSPEWRALAGLPAQPPPPRPAAPAGQPGHAVDPQDDEIPF